LTVIDFTGGSREMYIIPTTVQYRLYRSNL
jgi:hypothetical protein